MSEASSYESSDKSNIPSDLPEGILVSQEGYFRVERVRPRMCSCVRVRRRCLQKRKNTPIRRDQLLGSIFFEKKNAYAP